MNTFAQFNTDGKTVAPKSKLEGALAANDGTCAVFPVWETLPDGSCACGDAECKSKGKHPSIPNGHLQATRDAVQIMDWWTANPNRNIGRTPDKDHVFIDLDKKPAQEAREAIGEKGKEGFRAAKAAKAAIDGVANCLMLKVGEEVKAAPRVKTPRDGRHVLFTTGGISYANSQSKIAPGIDVRGPDGYVLAPGSSIFINGVETFYEKMNEAKPQPLPKALADKMEEVAEKVHKSRVTVGKLDTENRIRNSVAFVSNPKRCKPSIEGQGGNGNAYAVAAKLQEIGISVDRAMDILMNWTVIKQADGSKITWNDSCDGPWDYDDLLVTVQNGFNYCQKSPGTGDLMEVVDIAEGLDVGDTLEESEVAALKDKLERNVAAPETVIDQAEAALSDEMHNLRDQVLAAAVPYKGQDPTKMESMPWLYGKSALRGEVGITLAASGVGKTALLLLMLHDMTTSTLNLERLHKGPLRAGFISFEDSKHILELRMEAIRKHYGGDENIWGDRLLLMSMLPFGFKLTCRDENGIEVIDEKAFALLKEVILLNRLDYLTMDPWANMHGLAENDNVAAAHLVARLKRLAIETNIFINIIHHVRKSIRGQDELNQEDSRGASALVSATRVKRIINPMSLAEARKYSILDTERWRYIRIVDGDSNHAARRASEWFKKFGIDLGNAQDPATLAPGELPYEQDNVVVLERVIFKTAGELISASQVEAILGVLDRDLARASDVFGKETRFVDVIAEAMGLKWDDPAARKTIKEVRDRLLAGAVVAKEQRLGPSRHKVEYIVPGKQSYLREHALQYLPDIAENEDDDVEIAGTVASKALH